MLGSDNDAMVRVKIWLDTDHRTDFDCTPSVHASDNCR